MKRFVVFLVAIAVSLAVAGLYLTRDAATVAGTSISRQSLDTELSVIARSPDFQCYLSEEHQVSSGSPLPLYGTGTRNVAGGVYATAFVDSWLSSMVVDRATAAALRSEGIVPSPEALGVARGILARHITAVVTGYARDLGSSVPACGGSGRAVLSSLPKSFASGQVRAEADSALLAAHTVGASLDPTGVASYFHTHRKTFDLDCLSVIVVRARSTAVQVVRAIAAGAPFAEVAAQASLTQRSAAQGGAVGCGLLGGTFVAAALSHLAPGQVTAPVQGNGYWWVVKLTRRSSEPLSKLRDTVVTAIVAAGATRSDARVLSALRAEPLAVDPRYGTASNRGAVTIAPPVLPPASALVAAPASARSVAAPALP